ncbi:hypothetical protein DSO57_1005033 [Entomophthora muscae]|uniref:Uncharacterized protein n=1 Tax=Entomophthora muscae TaxID=34485 RepID=A0ACC2UI51_9FUNG|nr:hypothetical protein DSO57_1005033 [Entomophthora muscae]
MIVSLAQFVTTHTPWMPPLSTLKKHLRVKHGFSIRHPPKQQDTFNYFVPKYTHKRIDIKSLLNPETPVGRGSVQYQPGFRPHNFTFVYSHPY